MPVFIKEDAYVSYIPKVMHLSDLLGPIKEI